MHWHASNSQYFVKDMQCLAVVNFTEFEWNNTADTCVRSFNHTIWPIKARHSHSLCSKIEFIRHLTYLCLFFGRVSLHCFTSCTPGIIYGPISSHCMGVASRWNYNGDCMIKIFHRAGVVTPSKPPLNNFRLYPPLHLSPLLPP